MVTLDLGTTHIKAVGFSITGGAIVSREAQADTLANGEQDVVQLSSQTLKVLKGVFSFLSDQGFTPIGLCLSGAMHSILGVNAEGKPLTAALTWSDHRGQLLADELSSSRAGRSIYEKTGTPIHPMSPLVKIAWMKKNQPEAFRSTHRFVSVKEYVFHMLCGEWKVDYSVASATGLFDSSQLNWCAEAIDFAGIVDSQLSKVVSPLSTYPLLPEIREYFGTVDLKVIIGASDGCLAHLGSGVIGRSNAISITLGTSAAVRTSLSAYAVHPEGKTFTYMLEEKFFIKGGPSNNGGNVIDWLSQWAAPEVEPLPRRLASLSDLSTMAPPGSNGLIFLPFLFGERAPIWDGRARAEYVGLHHEHQRAHFVRACVEGILFNLRHIKGMVISDGETGDVKVGGGLSKSKSWMQMFADILGTVIQVDSETDSSSVGAAVMGLKALHIIDSYDEAAAFYRTTDVYRPNPHNVLAYNQCFASYMLVVAQYIKTAHQL